MDDFLTPVSTTYLKHKPEAAPAQPKRATPKIASASSAVSNLEEAIDVLKNQPDYDALVSTLRFLSDKADSLAGKPSPQAAAIVHLLVTDIVPNYWTLLLEDNPLSESGALLDRKGNASLLLLCLRNVTGLNAAVARLNSLLVESRQRPKDVLSQDTNLHIHIYLDLIASILFGDNTIFEVWSASVQMLPEAALRKMQAHTLGSLMANSRILSVASEAASIVGVDKLKPRMKFIVDGAEYAAWLATNLASWAKTATTEVEFCSCHDVLQRAMSLGYQSAFVKSLTDKLLLQTDSNPHAFIKVCSQSPATFKKVMQILLEYLAQRFLNYIAVEDQSENKMVAAVAGLVHALVIGDSARTSFAIQWCTSSSGAGLGDGIGIRRAVLAALATDNDAIASVLEKSLSQFGDELYIKHTAILQQEVHTQILLLSAGYVSRLSSIRLALLVKSGAYMSTISNRIASTQERTRILGMVAGESLSALVEKDNNKLDFHMDELETEDVGHLKSLTGVSDVVGSIHDLLVNIPSVDTPTPSRSSSHSSKQKIKSVKRPKSKPNTVSTLPKAIIEELDSSDDDDLVPYIKGSDPEDSDDDAELVQRNKPKPPVYIRDLISYFRDTENYDKQKLALQTAPTLVRRKANYGKEVMEHADELAGILAGLQDKFEMDSFGEMQLECMVALIVAQPQLMAPWFARTFFEGDYSLSQRTAVLIAIGLASREVSGFDTGTFRSSAEFPSKLLPEKVQQLYLHANRDGVNRSDGSDLKALPPNAIESMSQALTADFLAPVAATAADSVTGPDVFKLQSFTAQHKRKTRATKPRVRAIANTTAAIIADSFFSPLTAHFQVALRSSRRAVLNPAMLALYLQTLGILVHAAGPTTLALPRMTSELWQLLLGVRVHVVEDLGALRGWLAALAALLQLNGDNDSGMRRLCETHGRELFETREWVGAIFSRLRGGDASGEENGVKMLAAGALITLGEAVEKYQALLMGDMASFT